MGYLKNIGRKKYRIVYDVLLGGGTRRQKTETLANVTEKEARIILANREEVVRKGEFVQDNITFSDIAEKFLANKESRVSDGRLSPNTLRRYRCIYKTYLKRAFGHLHVKEIKRLHLSSAYEQWCKVGPCGRKVSSRTVLHAHQLFSTMLNWAVHRELATRNVAALLTEDELPKVVTPKPQALSEAELKLVLDEAQHPTSRSAKRGYSSSQLWFYPAVFFAAYTGCRRGETLAVRWSDINFEEKSVTICRSLAQTENGLLFKRPKNDKTRTISLSDRLAATLKTHKAQQAQEQLLLGAAYKKADLVFAQPDGSPVCPSIFGDSFKNLIERMTVTQISLHGLRDTHASLLAKAGVPIEVISRRLGHSSINITMDRYMHVYRERDEDAASAFDKLVS